MPAMPVFSMAVNQRLRPGPSCSSQHTASGISHRIKIVVMYSKPHRQRTSTAANTPASAQLLSLPVLHILFASASPAQQGKSHVHSTQYRFFAPMVSHGANQTAASAPSPAPVP